jgi:hypothetical protein
MVDPVSSLWAVACSPVLRVDHLVNPRTRTHEPTHCGRESTKFHGNANPCVRVCCLLRCIRRKDPETF